MPAAGAMHRIAVIGANGQVGSELCLLLSRMAGMQVIPICRNPTGSAFLRYSGIPCRHGRPAYADEAVRLVGDCDVVVNCALGTGTPSEIRAFDRSLLHSLFRSSPPQAAIIHCSTLMVHGDPRPDAARRTRDAYGRAKFAAEGRVRRESRRYRKPGFILRLGHVCGELQNITAKIRGEISAGSPLLPEVDVASNVVYTATIADAIAAIMAGRERPGTYDLTNVPQWTWRQVYEYEAGRLGVPFTPIYAPAESPRGSALSASARARRLVGSMLQRPAARRQLERFLAIAPSGLNDRAQAIWFKMRAQSEIRLLVASSSPSPELSWIALDRRPLSSLRPTRESLADPAFTNVSSGGRPRWPPDLPPAAGAAVGSVPQEQMSNN
jgi:nucleoside-diphosphate-sugar epimerase